MALTGQALGLKRSESRSSRSRDRRSLGGPRGCPRSGSSAIGDTLLSTHKSHGQRL